MITPNWTPELELWYFFVAVSHPGILLVSSTLEEWIPPKMPNLTCALPAKKQQKHSMKRGRIFLIFAVDSLVREFIV
jgi:hypothetical protein